METKMEKDATVVNLSFHLVDSKNGNVIFTAIIISEDEKNIDELNLRFGYFQTRTLPVIEIDVSGYLECPIATPLIGPGFGEGNLQGALSLSWEISPKNAFWFFGPRGIVRADYFLKGTGFMSYCFRLLVARFRNSLPDGVTPKLGRLIDLSPVDAKTPSERISRNRFYQSCGFKYNGASSYEDLEEGKLSANIEDLPSIDSFQKRFYSLDSDHFSELIFGKSINKIVSQKLLYPDLKKFSQTFINDMCKALNVKFEIFHIKNELSINYNKLTVFKQQPFFKRICSHQKRQGIETAIETLEKRTKRLVLSSNVEELPERLLDTILDYALSKYQDNHAVHKKEANSYCSDIEL